MQDEFEKRMQQKMDELKLHPSESVWQNVEANITGKTKRRRYGWIFFSLMLISLFAGIYFFQISKKHLQVNYSEIKKDFNDKTKVTNTESTIKISAKKIATVRKPATIKSFIDTNTYRDQYAKSLLKINGDKRILLTDRKNSYKKDKHEAFNKQNSDYTNTTTQQINDEINPNASKGFDHAGDLKEIISDSINKANDIATGDKDSSFIKNVSPTQTKNDTTAFIYQSKKINPAKPASVRHSWKFGVNFSAGISGVSNNFLGSLDKSFVSTDALYSTTPPGNYGSPLPSKIRSSGAMAAGFFLQKNISKKKIISIGFNYKLFSTTSMVGEKRDSLQIYRLNSLFYSLDNAENNYHNYYHFIEVPLSLKVQLTSKAVPLFFDAGVTISQLISSNALQLDNVAVVYKKQNSLFNKTQLGFSSGLSASLSKSKKNMLLIGPYLYYGFSKIAKEGLYKNQHFTFIGLRSQWLL